MFTTRRLFLIVGCMTTFGCNLGPGPIDLSKRSSVAVDAETDKVLANWQKSRERTRTISADFQITARGPGGKVEGPYLGRIRFRHPNEARLEFKSEGTNLWTASNELWELDLTKKEADVRGFDRNRLSDYIRGSYFVWFASTDREAVQKHGRVRKMHEDSATVVLRVEAAKWAEPDANDYAPATIHLRKPDLLPIKIVLNERDGEGGELIWEFTNIRENVAIDNREFAPPTAQNGWKVTRRKTKEKPSAANEEKASKNRP